MNKTHNHEEKTDYRFTSNAFWNAPGMVRNYIYGLKVNDEWMVNLFETAYEGTPRKVFDELAAGNYTQEGEFNGGSIIVTV